MSYRFRHGLILRDCTYEQALGTLKALRTKCLDIASTVLCQKASEYLVMKSDMAQNVCWLDDDHWSPPSFTKELEEAQRMTSVGGSESPQWDYTLELVLIPWYGNLLVLYYAQNDPGYRDAMLSLGFEEFYYFNDTDRPENIPEREWLARRDAWFGCGLTDYEAPSSLGFCYKVVSWQDLLEAPVWWMQRSETVMDPMVRRRAVAEALVGPEVDQLFKKLEFTVTDYLVHSWKLIADRAPDVRLTSDEALELDFHDLF